MTLFEASFIFGILCYILVPMIISEMQHMGHLLKVYSETELDIPFLPGEIHDLIKKYIDLEYLSKIMRNEDRMKLIENQV